MALLLELPDLLARMNVNIASLTGDAGEQAKATYLMWLVGMDRAVKNYCHWELTQTLADTQFYSGNGATDLPLRTPFTSNDSTLAVYLNQTGYGGQNSSSPFDSTNLLTKGTDYMLRLEGTTGKSGVLVKLPGNAASGSFPWWPSSQFATGRSGLAWRQGTFWPLGSGNIKVVCNYGFAPGSVPEDLRMAVAMGVALVRNLAQKGVVVTSEALGDYNYSGQLIMQAPFATVQSYLNKYRDVSL